MSSVARLVGDAGPEKISILDWPKLLRDELDMKVIDLNSGVLSSTEPAYLDRVRAAADKAGCILTNLKINRSDIDIGNRDADVRTKALAECKRWIDAAARLGLWWARPLPLKELPEMPAFVASYQELADYAAERNVQMLVENYGWMDADAEAVPRLIQQVGRNVAPCPDTGNWASQEVRYAGLAKMFPNAPTCDFKAGKLGPDGEHAAWDLKKCFAIAWDAGFRGPWCLEHAHTDRKELFRELALLRDMLCEWMKERA
jgi:sugar phosphate isomerase/epimerase